MLFPHCTPGLPTAVAHMGKLARRRDKPITPQTEGTPAGTPSEGLPASRFQALLDVVPSEPGWRIPKDGNCVTSKARRVDNIQLANLIWYAPQEDNSDLVREIWV